MAVRKNSKKRLFGIYEVNDVFSVMGYSLVGLTVINQFGLFETSPIAVNGIVDLFKGLFDVTTTGNLVAFTIGIGAVLTEKYFEYGRLM